MFFVTSGFCFAENSNYIYKKNHSTYNLDSVIELKDGAGIWEGFYELLAYEYDYETNVSTSNIIFSKELSKLKEILSELEINRKYYTYTFQFKYDINNFKNVEFIDKKTYVEDVKDSPSGSVIFVMYYYLCQ